MLALKNFLSVFRAGSQRRKSKRFLLLALLVLVSWSVTGFYQISAEGVQGQLSTSPHNQPTQVTFPGYRAFTLNVPSGYDPHVPAPLIIALHGYDQSGVDVEKLIHLSSAANAHGIFYVYPNGSADAGGVRFWNATPECCDFHLPKVNDQQYLLSVIDRISAQYSVDPRRVYIVGHSNGGFMANAMACNHSDRIAAIVDIAGGNYGKLSLCHPSQPINVLEVWGTKDVTYSGNHILGKSIAGAVKTIQRWAAIDACALSPIKNPQKIDIDSKQPGAETTVINYAQCKDGTEVEMWQIKGAEHQPQFSSRFDELMIQFLLSHPQTNR